MEEISSTLHEEEHSGHTEEVQLVRSEELALVVLPSLLFEFEVDWNKDLGLLLQELGSKLFGTQQGSAVEAFRHGREDQNVPFVINRKLVDGIIRDAELNETAGNAVDAVVLSLGEKEDMEGRVGSGGKQVQDNKGSNVGDDEGQIPAGSWRFSQRVRRTLDEVTYAVV